MMTHTVLASQKILRRIKSVQEQITRAEGMGKPDQVESLTKVRSAYVADLIDVLNEEERDKEKSERKSYNLASTEAWIKEHIEIIQTM